MKPEFKVKVYHKGGEFSFNGGPMQRMVMYPAIVDAWVPTVKGKTVLFKVGRSEFAITLKRVCKGGTDGRLKK